MLAPTFASAKALRISEIERQAAIRVLENLECGFYQNVGPADLSTHGFNMNFWFERTKPDCHVGCIGGWMAHEKGRTLSNNIVDRWEDLFHPPYLRAENAPIFTVERAARALRVKLETGAKYCWDDDELFGAIQVLNQARRREREEENRKALRQYEYDQAYEEATWENAWRAVGMPPWSRDVLGRPVPFYGEPPPFVARAR